MAGRARLQALTEELDRRTAEAFDGWDDSSTYTHLDYICHRVENGTTTKDLAIDLERSLGFEFSYGAMMRYLSKQFGEEAATSRIDSARARASHWLVDEAIAIVDEKQDDGVGVARARARANQRNWMAERYNPGRFGSKQGVSVNVSIGSLHLDALRARAAVVTAAPQHALSTGESTLADATQVVDAEVVE